MSRLRKTLSYGNVMATVAVFLAMSGAAVAVTSAPTNSVTSASIKDGQVKAPDVRAGAVTAPKLATNAVRSRQIADGAVTGAKIADGGVGNADLADDSVDGTKIATGGVGTDALATDSVIGSNIATSAVNSSHIAADAINSSHLADDSVGASHLKGVTPVVSSGTLMFEDFANPSSAQVTCPPGQMVIAGGYAWRDDEPNSIIYSAPSEIDPTRTWTVRGMVDSGSNVLYAWANCLAA